MKPDIELEAVVLSVVFSALESGWSVVEMEGEESFTAVGPMPRPVPGERLRLTGHWTEHALYGRQFQVTATQALPLVKRDEIERFLASGAIHGMGPQIAARVVNRFGDESLDVIANKPDLLMTVPGIGKKTAQKFQAALQARERERGLALLLLPVGISFRRVLRIQQFLGLSAESEIKNDPWILARKVPGIGSATVQRLADRMAIPRDAPVRIQGTLVFALEQELTYGHTWAPREKLVAAVARELELETSQVEAALVELPPELLAEEGDEGTTLAFRDVYGLERYAAEQIGRRLQAPHSRPPVSEKVIEMEAAVQGLALADEQRAAVAMALNQPFSVITGGPGTGKTTIVRLVVALARRRGEKVLLAAPTGRAARRLAESTGEEAATLHRLLNLSPEDDERSADFKNITSLRADFITVDEASMIDQMLFSRLLAALKPRTRLLLVGDRDQLPSIGPGQVLADLLAVDQIPKTTLTRIYRQDEGNLIVLNAHRLKNGEALVLHQELSSPFLFVERASDEDITAAVMKLISEVLPQKYGLRNLNDIQVLAPMRRGSAGVKILNEGIQTWVQKGLPRGLEAHGQVFALGDRVMQTRNNYELLWQSPKSGRGLGIMNGEIGRVVALNQGDDSLVVEFEDERLVTLAGLDLDDLELAYATTIHKSQGSEYEAVILALGSGPPDFLTRNLVYTALTRARRYLFLVARKRTLWLVLNNDRVQQRRTRLAAEIQLRQ